jgi:hypothetical protein
MLSCLKLFSYNQRPIQIKYLLDILAPIMAVTPAENNSAYAKHFYAFAKQLYGINKLKLFNLALTYSFTITDKALHLTHILQNNKTLFYGITFKFFAYHPTALI